MAKQPSASNSQNPWFLAFVVAIVILSIGGLYMWRVGMLDAVKDDSDKNLIAASLVVVGSLISAVVALIGIVVKYSIDAKNLQIASQAQYSNHIDVAIRAVGLLTADTTSHQNGGALLALVNLNQLELAVTLLDDLWPQRLVSSAVAGVVIERCISEGSESDSIKAATVLSDNSNQIEGPNFSTIWPIPDLGWRTDLPESCRLGLISAACGWMAYKFESDQTNLPPAAAVLYHAMDDPIAHKMAAVLLSTVNSFPPNLAIVTGNDLVTVEDILKKLPPVTTTNDNETIEIIRRIQAAFEKGTE